MPSSVSLALWHGLSVALLLSLLTLLAVAVAYTQRHAIGGLTCLPIIVLLVVFRGAPSRSIAQVLYDADGRERAGLRRDHVNESSERS